MTFLKRKIEGSIEVTGRRGRRRKQLLDDLKEKRGYWKLQEEALDRTLLGTRFGRGYGHLVKAKYVVLPMGGLARVAVKRKT